MRQYNVFTFIQMRQYIVFTFYTDVTIYCFHVLYRCDNIFFSCFIRMRQYIVFTFYTDVTIYCFHVLYRCDNITNSIRYKISFSMCLVRLDFHFFMFDTLVCSYCTVSALGESTGTMISLKGFIWESAIDRSALCFFVCVYRKIQPMHYGPFARSLG